MNKQLAVALCIHHKPWLVMSTLISLALQDFKDFDLYFLYQIGDGACQDKKSYEEYFKFCSRYGKNSQLSEYDENSRKIARATKFKGSFEVEFENDHTLDSGAWYKFIQSEKWKAYDYVLFIQEGSLFTRENVISSALDFIRKNNIHFLSSGHEKRKVAKNIFIKPHLRTGEPNEFDFYVAEKIEETFSIFCRDPEFNSLYKQWGSDFKTVTQNHVPDTTDTLKKFVLHVLISLKNNKPLSLFKRIIYNNSQRQFLDDVVNGYNIYKGVIYHQDNQLEWFGCSCQHFFTNAFLESFTDKIKKYSLYDALDIPFSGEALEIIWGFLPNWLGFDKWFFDGIHRVRKNFASYVREDNPPGMCNYINKYFHKQIHVLPEGNCVKIDKIAKRYLYIKEFLGKDYFSDG